MSVYSKFWRNAFKINSVASRKEFTFVLITVVAGIITNVFYKLFIKELLNVTGGGYWYDTTLFFHNDLVNVYKTVLIVAAVYFLISFIPALTCTIRRLHDMNKSGLYVLFLLIPIINIFILIWFSSGSEKHQNNRWYVEPQQ